LLKLKLVSRTETSECIKSNAKVQKIVERLWKDGLYFLLG